MIYGRAHVEVKEEQIGGEDANVTYLTVQQGEGKTVGPYSTGFAVRKGDYVAVTVGQRMAFKPAEGGGSEIMLETAFTSCEVLSKQKNVPNSAWSGQSAVTIGGRTYTIPSDVLCYNKLTGQWMTLSQAHAYASSTTMYLHHGAVRAIEVG